MGLPSDVQIKEEDLYQITEATLAGLAQIDGYPTWALADLNELDWDKQYTYEGFKLAMDVIDPYFIVDLYDDEWDATLGYLTVVQSEIVSYENSPVYSRELFDEFVSMTGGENAVIGVVSSSSQDVADSYLFYMQAFQQAGVQEVLWIPVDLAYRKARDEGEC